MIEQLREKYPNIYDTFFNWFKDKQKGIITNYSDFINFLDNEKLLIGITVDKDGIDWIIEINGIFLDFAKSRQEATELAIDECFNILENH